MANPIFEQFVKYARDPDSCGFERPPEIPCARCDGDLVFTGLNTTGTAAFLDCNGECRQCYMVSAGRVERDPDFGQRRVVKTEAPTTPVASPVKFSCPHCGADVPDVAKWVADGRRHQGCLGSEFDRLRAEREEAQAESAVLRQALIAIDHFAGSKVEGGPYSPEREKTLSAICGLAQGAYLRAGAGKALLDEVKHLRDVERSLQSFYTLIRSLP